MATALLKNWRRLERVSSPPGTPSHVMMLKASDGRLYFRGFAGSLVRMGNVVRRLSHAMRRRLRLRRKQMIRELHAQNALADLVRRDEREYLAGLVRPASHAEIVTQAYTQPEQHDLIP